MAGAGGGGVDLSFLSEAEARQVRHVLERDSRLRRAERERLSKLQKKKQEVPGLQGVTGEWFEEIQRKKFRNDTDVSRMLKRPLAHWLGKTSRNDPKEFKISPQNQQAQKNGSPSILGFRTPFASLFSFKKSRKHSLKHQPQEQPSRYDSLALGISSKVEEMAQQAETCNSSLPAELPCKLLDANQAEVMEGSEPVWNEQLEKELFHVLGDLDNQLAQEQVQDSVNRRTLVDSGPRAQYHFPSASRQTVIRQQHRNNWSQTPSTFFSDGMRTIRAKEDQKLFFGPRKFYDTYTNRCHSTSLEDYLHKDSFDSSYPVLSRRLSSASFGDSSEGSFHVHPTRQSSGFGHTRYMGKGTVGRSYSVCSLQSYPSSASSDLFSTTSLHQLTTENSSGFIQRNSRQTPKRIPLSSIVWTKPSTSGQTANQDKFFRTQSLKEFNTTSQDTHPRWLHENGEYEFYRSKHHYRRAVSSTNWFSSANSINKNAAPLSLDNWENHPLYWLENNLFQSHYRDTACHGRFQTHQKSSLFGREEKHPSSSNIYQYYNDEVFLSPNAHYEMIMSNLNDHQSAHARNVKVASQHCQSDFQTCVSGNRSSVEISRGADSKVPSKQSKDLQSCLTYKSAVTLPSIKGGVSNESVLLDSRVKTKLTDKNSSSVTKVSKSQSQPLVTETNIKKDFEKAASEKVRDLELSGRVDQKSIKDIILQPVSQTMDTNNTFDLQISPCNNSGAAALQNSTSFLNSPLSLSARQTQLTGTREITKINISDSCKRNEQRKENDLPAQSDLNQAPSLLSAESRRGSFLSSLKQWEHHLLNLTKRKGTKLVSQRLNATDHITSKGQSFLVGVVQSSSPVQSAPITETLAKDENILPSPLELLSGSSQDSLQVFSHKSYPKSLETPTSSSMNCRVTEAPVEDGKVVHLASGVAKDTPQENLQDQDILVNKDHKSQLTAGCSQNKNCKNIYAHNVDRGSAIAECSLNYFCLERENGKTRGNASCIERSWKQGSFLRYTTSSSIDGSPGKSYPESPESEVIYYTLPRKSASISGSVMSDTPISFPRSKVPSQIKTTVWDHVDKQTSDGTAAFPFNQGNKISSLRSTHPCITPAFLNGGIDTKEDILQNKDCSLPLNRSPSHSLSGSIVVSESDQLTQKEKPINRNESPGCSDSLEKEMGDSLQKYKTTSTFTVSGDEDHIQYHELVSIYYTLPRRCSRTVCNLVLNDPEITALPLFTEKSQSPKVPKKSYEVRIGLANVDFPSTLEKGRPSHVPDQMYGTSVTLENAKTTAVDTDWENSHLSPRTEVECPSQSASTVHSKQDNSPELALKESTHVLSDMVTSDISVCDPKSTAEVDASVKTTTSTSHNQNINMWFSSDNEKNILHTSTPLTSSLSIPLKNRDIPENVHFTSAINSNCVQNRDFKNCEQSIEEGGGSNQNILSSHVDNNSSHEGKNCTKSAPAESKSWHDIKGGSDFEHESISLYNNKCTGFQLGADKSRNSTDEELISDSKILSNSRNKSFRLGTVSTVTPILQPATICTPLSNELLSPKTKQKQISQTTQMDKDLTSLQKAVMYSEDRQNGGSKDKLSSITQDLQLLQSKVSENKPISDCTRDKVNEIEEKKNRLSVKNKVATIYKTSRKFCNKNVNPKSHISDIFSQNDGGTTSLEINMPHGTLCYPASTLQSGNKNQNQKLIPVVCDTPVHAIPENNKRSQANEDSSLIDHNKNQRSITNSCNHIRDVNSPKQNENEVESMLSSTTLFPNETATRSKNSQTPGQKLENGNQLIFSRPTVADLSGKQKRISTVSSHDPLLLPFLTDNNSNMFIQNLQTNICSQQQGLSTGECNHDQNIRQSKSLKNANLHSNRSRMSRAKHQRERHFSESTYTQDSHDNHSSGSKFLPKGSRYSRKFKSYSELCSHDENENWALYDEGSTTYGTRRVMYPSIEFGIFGKEQQQAFLENIKRSLTEGRLWRPSLLKNPGFLKNEERDSLKRAELLRSSSAGSKMSVDASSPRERLDIYQEESMVYSDSDTETTTDDEYYLEETDKESEL